MKAVQILFLNSHSPYRKNKVSKTCSAISNQVQPWSFSNKNSLCGNPIKTSMVPPEGGGGGIRNGRSLEDECVPE